jgi:hypothetical protein
MPADKYGYRPAQGDYGGVYSGYGPKELRTFGEQVKHVACSNFGFSAELDGKTPPPDCDKGVAQPGKNSRRAGRLSPRFVQGAEEIDWRDDREKYVRSHRRALRGPRDAPGNGQRGGLARRRSLRPTRVIYAAQRHCAARQPPQSAGDQGLIGEEPARIARNPRNRVAVRHNGGPRGSNELQNALRMRCFGALHYAGVWAHHDQRHAAHDEPARRKPVVHRRAHDHSHRARRVVADRRVFAADQPTPIRVARSSYHQVVCATMLA